VGAISYSATAAWPYRLVACLLRNLLSAFPASFSIETHTPATHITTSETASSKPFTVHTPRGSITTTHIVHATNGHAAHLLPGIKGKLFPVLGHMSAQNPGLSFPHLSGSRSWGFIYREGFDYLTQRPGPAGEIMLGGALMRSPQKGLDQLGVSRDDQLMYFCTTHLSGVLPVAFGASNWGGDAPGGRVKSVWSGIMGFTADALPYVGILDPALTGRSVQAIAAVQGAQQLAPAEWIAAGYSGEGMVNAWLCGVAVALMVLGREEEELSAKEMAEEPGRPEGKVKDWLPDELRVSTHRVRNSNVIDLLLEWQ
jgi:glycine/D-amino acid oxidase-like deaminating enzyme